MLLEISQNSQENTCARVSFLIKLQALHNVIEKETLTQVFSCEFYEIPKNMFYYRTPLVAASVEQRDDLLGYLCSVNFGHILLNNLLFS